MTFQQETDRADRVLIYLFALFFVSASAFVVPPIAGLIGYPIDPDLAMVLMPAGLKGIVGWIGVCFLAMIGGAAH